MFLCDSQILKLMDGMVSMYVDLKNLSIGLFEGGRRRQVKMIIIKKTRERKDQKATRT